MLSVLGAMGLPPGLIRFISQMYSNTHTYLSCLGLCKYMCRVGAGVLQGCPLSGTLYALVTDVFLCELKEYINDTKIGVITACADDIGGALTSFRHLRVLAPVFKKFSKLAGLDLKPK
eukprot:5932742-Karenia_brevis.AAC.1